MLASMRSSLAFLLATVAAVGAARADDARPRSIWLECQTPAVWPLRAGAPVRLNCRIDTGPSAQSLPDTVNPFAIEARLVDPFAVQTRYVDVFETGKYARPRAQPVVVPEPVNPFADDIVDPFEPPREETVEPAAR
jgi:hypothetical protein